MQTSTPLQHFGSDSSFGNLSLIASVNEDKISQTSTVDFNQEPFSSFQSKVRELVQELFQDHTANSIAVERIESVILPHTIGITVSGPSAMKRLRHRLSVYAREKLKKAPSPRSHVLHIPRGPAFNLHCQASMLAYLQHRLPYTVPSVIHYDSGVVNVLGRAYALQEALPGKTLHKLWPTLTFEQRKCAVRCISNIIVDVHNITHSCAGIVSPHNTSYNYSSDNVKLQPIPMPGASSMAQASANPDMPFTTRDLLLDLVARQRVHTETIGNSTSIEIWDGFQGMINKLYALGLLPDTDSFHLYHPDLHSRNLLFTIQSPDMVRLTGIINWDRAHFAPRFMSIRVPFSSWTDGDSDDEEDSNVFRASTVNLQAYKDIFRDVAGTQFCADAVRPEYVLARRMWQHLVDGFNSGSDKILARNVLHEWQALHPTVVLEDVE